MIRKIKLWWHNRRRATPTVDVQRQLYTHDQVIKIAEDFGKVRYNDGKRDGIAIAREQATKSLKEILWQQNKTK